MTKWKLKNKWWVSIHLFKLEELIQIQEKNMKYHPPKKVSLKAQYDKVKWKQTQWISSGEKLAPPANS